MQLTMENTGGANRIRAYDVGSVTVNEHALVRTTVVMRDDLITDWEPEDIRGLTEHHLERLLQLDPELIVIGTGRWQRFPDRRVLSRLIRAGIGVEVMTTPAACRTYNVLVAENRRAIAALFMIEPDPRDDPT